MTWSKGWFQGRRLVFLLLLEAWILCRTNAVEGRSFHKRQLQDRVFDEEGHRIHQSGRTLDIGQLEKENASLRDEVKKLKDELHNAAGKPEVVKQQAEEIGELKEIVAEEKTIEEGLQQQVENEQKEIENLKREISITEGKEETNSIFVFLLVIVVLYGFYALYRKMRTPSIDVYDRYAQRASGRRITPAVFGNPV